MADISTLTCPSCGASLSTTGQATRLRCEYCGNLHILDGKNPQATQPLRRRIFAPQSVRIFKDENGRRIVKRWFSFQYILMAFFVVFWDGFLLFWYGVSISGGAPVLFMLFPLVHLAIGLVLTYTCLAGFVNKTTIELSQKELAVYFDPLPWPGEKTVQTRDIKQIYCKDKVTYSRKGRERHSYKLCVLTHELREIELVSHLDNPDAALFFEQQLELWLNIEDVPVQGELEKV